MSDSSASKACPKCGATLPSEATAGLCPRCLMAEAMVPTQPGGEAAAARPALAPEELAPHFPQLEILECLGRGGMGVVYKARQKSLNRVVALKLLAPERVGDAGFAGRFQTEAHALAKLNHPAIVTVYDFGQAGGFYFLLMEFVDGMNLRQLLNAGRIAPREALAIVPQICDALQYAHDAGIVHRDIKPENILLDRRGRVKVADFGLAKLIGQSDSNPSESATASIGNPQSAISNAIMGTPQYMAPEQVAHPSEVDHRADIYSLGVVFYQMLTGELPKGDLAPPSRKVVLDVRLDEVVLRAMEKRPELRYQQVSDVKTMVETIAATPAAAAARPQVPSLGRSGSPDVQALDEALPPRFSRLALWGALWLLINPLAAAVCALATPYNTVPVTDGPVRWGLNVLSFVFLALSVLCPIGTTALGWIAVAQIRRSAGRLRGLGLALIDGLLFPLFALDAAIVLAVGNLWRANPPRYGTWLGGFLVEHKSFTFLFALLVCVAVDILIIRAVWRAVNKGGAPQVPSVGKTDTSDLQALEKSAAPGFLRRAVSRRLKKSFLASVALAVLVVAPIMQVVFVQMFVAATDAAAPEIPRGSRCLVWKLAKDYAPGDLIAYRYQGHVNLGRFAGAATGELVVRRNHEPDFAVPRNAVIGKVITVLWRGSSIAAQNCSFGPVIERDICFNSVTNSLNRFLDLDSGQFVTPTPEVGLHFAKDEWIGRYYGVDSKEAGAAMQEWVRTSGADMMADGGQKRLTLLGGWGFDQDTRDAGLVEFDRADPDRTFQRLAGIDADMCNSAHLAIRLSFLHPPGWYSVGRQPSRKIERPQPHDTALFRTAAGSMGILQFGEFRENPPRVTIRYKLVRRGSTKAAAVVKPAPADEKPAFGPEMEQNFRSDAYMWTNCWAFNLASGQVLRFDLQRPPPDATNSLAITATGQPDFPLSLDRRMPSFRAAHVDLMQHMDANIPDMLMTFDMHLIRLSTNDWNLSAAEAAARLAPVAATIHDPSMEIITGEHVYLFATRDGARGILQIMRESTHLRYKLIHGGVVANLTPGFGPVIARELVAAPYQKEQDALDLDEGRVLPVPEKLIHQNNPRGLLDWMVANRLDLIINNTLTEDFLGLHLDDGFFIRTPPQFAFDSIDVGEVSRHQAKPGPLQYVMLPKNEIKDQPVFLFQTREGGRGVLQITGFAPDSGTVKLRYKLVQGGAANAAAVARPAPTDASAPPQLRYLAWQHENLKTLFGYDCTNTKAWRVDGSPVDSIEEKRLLQIHLPSLFDEFRNVPTAPRAPARSGEVSFGRVMERIVEESVAPGFKLPFGRKV